MKTTRFSLMHIALTLGLLVFAFSFKKDDGYNIFTDTPSYIPTSMLRDGIPVDSFQYNNDYTLSRLFYYDEATRTWPTYYEFRYDGQGRLQGYTYKNTLDDYSYNDTIIYSNGSIFDLKKFIGENNLVAYDTNARFCVDVTNRIALLGTRDTLVYDYRKYVDFYGYNYRPDNVPNVNYNYNSPYNFEETYTENSAYLYQVDNKRNPFAFVFAKSPIFAVIMNYYDYDPVFSTGKNNYTKLTGTAKNNGNEESININFQNTYLEGTDYLSEQTMQIQNENGYNTIALKYNLQKTK